MLTKSQIERYLRLLNDLLQQQGIKGEICLYGGAAMCLAFKARPATKDIDAVFAPSGVIRQLAKRIADEHHLPYGWLNDGIKGFIERHRQRLLFNWTNLKVFYPEPEYLLAMKALSARIDSTDKSDVRFLIEKLGIQSAERVNAAQMQSLAIRRNWFRDGIAKFRKYGG